MIWPGKNNIMGLSAANTRTLPRKEDHMIYKDFKGLKLSALGMGTMRLPVVDGDENHIDQDHVEKMVAYAMDNGINYYDTAWGYHGGNSEISIGKALGKYPRDSFFLADKFPGYDLSNMGKIEEIFEKQLEKCGVDYFDFYLIHNVCELNINQYLDDSYGTRQYLVEQKKKGRIRHLGFSLHGGLDVTKKFLDKYGKDMEFCQMQLNYVDWSLQDAKSQVELLTQRDLPIWVMEPVRGGKLAALPEEDEARLKALAPDRSVVNWAFRFIQTVPGVEVTLSGMSDLEQMEENISIFGKEDPLSHEELDTLLSVAEDMVGRISLPCTACRYCTGSCPQGLDIPYLLDLYNQYCFTGGGFLVPMALGALPRDKKPWSCQDCGSCVTLCPQQIDIPGALKDFSAKLKENRNK